MSDDMTDLRDQVSRLCEQMSRNEQRLAKIEASCASCAPAIERRILRVEHDLDGNGRPGLNDRVTSIETKITVALWLIGLVNPVLNGVLIVFLTQ